ncbi:hypothetical protein [Kitasatospora sp. NPDC005856]|uniref:hypothetical protein n=1 Tax=Kitasatospora sp. NPDC005856 TaxID=3154566 RepID=UPI0033C35D3A
MSEAAHEQDAALLVVPKQSAQGVPKTGQEVALVKTGELVRIMSVHSFGIFVRPLRGGREQIKRLRDLVPPDNAPGGFNQWQASRG